MIASRRFTSLAALAAACLFVATFAALHRGWYDNEEIVDLPVYETYGNAIERGSIPYRDFRLEYPPAALPMFMLPALLSDKGDRPAFRRAFEGTMALCGALAILCAGLILAALGATRTRVVATLAAIAVFPLLLGSVVLTRFDLWPIALVLAALAALSAAVLIGFELVLTHWFYLYIPWFFPFVAFALLYRRDPSAQVH